MTKNSASFDVTNPVVVLRVMCGVFYIPHVLFKLNGMEGAATFFAKAGFSPPMAFVVLALVMEIACAVGLTFDLYTKWVGLLSAGVMGVAAYAVFNTKGVGWLWNLGGVEYLVFWAVSSLALAVHAWKAEWEHTGHLSLFGPVHGAA
ncbi:DoxX family protein [Azospirillum sp. sgz302134]